MPLQIVNKIDERKLAYALLSIMTETTDHLCIITKGIKEKELLNSIVEKFMRILNTHQHELKKIRIPNIIIVSEDEYYDHWEEYSKYRLIFVDDSYLKWSILDNFHKYLRDIIKKQKTIDIVFEDIINMLTLIDFLCSNVDLKPPAIQPKKMDKKKRKEYMEKRKKAERKLLSFFIEKLGDRKKAELALKILLYTARKIYM